MQRRPARTSARAQNSIEDDGVRRLLRYARYSGAHTNGAPPLRTTLMEYCHSCMFFHAYTHALAASDITS